MKGKYTVALFSPLKPMLACRRTMAETSKIIASTRYQIETKYDGERLHVHKQAKTMRLFSRCGLGVFGAKTIDDRSTGMQTK